MDSSRVVSYSVVLADPSGAQQVASLACWGDAGSMSSLFVRRQHLDRWFRLT